MQQEADITYHTAVHEYLQTDASRVGASAEDRPGTDETPLQSAEASAQGHPVTDETLLKKVANVVADVTAQKDWRMCQLDAAVVTYAHQSTLVHAVLRKHSFRWNRFVENLDLGNLLQYLHNFAAPGFLNSALEELQAALRLQNQEGPLILHTGFPGAVKRTRESRASSFPLLSCLSIWAADLARGVHRYGKGYGQTDSETDRQTD